MSVPRITGGVPGPVYGVPQGKPIPVISAIRHACESPRPEMVHFLRSGAGSTEGLSFEMLGERLPHGRGEAQHRAALPVLGVAHGDRGGRPAHLYAVALAAGVGGYPPARDRLIAHSLLFKSSVSVLANLPKYPVT